MLVEVEVVLASMLLLEVEVAVLEVIAVQSQENSLEELLVPMMN